MDQPSEAHREAQAVRSPAAERAVTARQPLMGGAHLEVHPP